VAVGTTAKAAVQASMQLFPYVAELARRGRYREAESWISVLLPVARHPELHFLLGQIHAQQRRYPDASRAFQAALDLDPCHAAAARALARSERLCERPGIPIGPWRIVVAAIVLLLAVAAIPLFLGSRGERAGETASVRESRPAASTSGNAQGGAAVPAGLLDEYASLVASLRAVPAMSSLAIRPRPNGERATVQVTGSVPTEHLAAAVRRAASPSSTIDLDTAGLTVTHRYVVQRRDTLSTIAAALYGDVNQWRVLWAANRRAVTRPDVIHPGTVLTTP
jgi:hypothetical protein